MEDIEEQKQSYEKELDELRTKLRKQRSADNMNNSQEVCWRFVFFEGKNTENRFQ